MPRPLSDMDDPDRTLRVQPPGEPAPSINPGRPAPDAPAPLTEEDYVRGILAGDRVILGRALTLVESRRPDHHRLAEAVVARCLPHTGGAARIGITGVPGAGKSTLIEALGTRYTAKGRRVAVLAIDPSSARTGGSILGDKTRMPALASDPLAFIRPSPTGGTLGGVARTTRESILLCEAAGYEVVFVETVGVGQSEIAAHELVDLFLLLVLAGAGDELQGIKRGIVEMADVIVVNKADGDNVRAADLARRRYEAAVHLYPPLDSGWTVPVLACSAMTGDGLDTLIETFDAFLSQAARSGHREEKRRRQALHWFRQATLSLLEQRLNESEVNSTLYPSLREQVLDGRLSPFGAARRLVDGFLGEAGVAPSQD